MELAIETRKLCVYYGQKPAVIDLDLKVRKGEIFGFLGPNGAGKTTTIKVLSTLLPPTSGSAYVLGYDVVGEGAEVRKRIGVVQQERSFESLLTVRKNLELYGRLWNVPKDKLRKRLETLLDKFELSEVKNVIVSSLSYGQLKRLQVAREFMHESELLFLDEPTAGLDVLARRTLLDYIKEEIKERGVTVFFTTHMLEEVEYICERVGLINKGKLIFVGKVEEVKNKFGGLSVIKLTVKKGFELNKQMLAVLPGVQEVSSEDEAFKILTTKQTETLRELIKYTDEAKVPIEILSIQPPSLEEAFIQAVSG